MDYDSINLNSIDLHIHTLFSDGHYSIKEAIKAAQVKRLKVIAITDHYSEFKDLPQRMSKTDLCRYLVALDGVPAFKGLEVEILEDGTVSMSSKLKRAFNFIIGGLHILHGIRFWGDSTPVLDPKRFVEGIRVALITAMESRLLDVLAHITWLPESIRPDMYNLMNQDWIRSVVAAASDYEVAIEVSGRWLVPNAVFVEECLRQGVKLSLGSDSHRIQQIGNVGYGVRLFKKLHVSKEMLFLPNES